jgi:TldD protein
LINDTKARLVLEAALSSGGDFAELYMEDGTSNRVTMLDGKVENATSARSVGAGVRVFSGVKSAYAYTADVSIGALIGAAKAAAAALTGDAPMTIIPFRPADYSVAPLIPYSTVDNARRIARMRDAHLSAKSYSDEIAQVSVTLMDDDKSIFVCNTEGVWASDRRPRMRLAVSSVATKDGVSQTGADSPGNARGFDGFDLIDPVAVGREASRQAVTMLHADECPAGVMPVVIDGGFGGVIFHEACGHALEATSVSKGNSVFCDKLGTKIAADCVSAADDGTIPGEWGSLHIDDEGTPTRRNLLIENGILKSYLIDCLGARRMGMDVTGSSRRQDYSYAPTSRMTNTFICEGTDDSDEMIRTMGDGIFAAYLGGGSVNPLTGEFNFAVREGYLVRDGKIIAPVRGATLIGRGADILPRIDRVGPHCWMAQGMCGSLSGSIPTNVGQPRIRVTEITVGGKGGVL